MLTQHLREMEQDGLIVRQDFNGKLRHVEYSLSHSRGFAALRLINTGDLEQGISTGGLMQARIINRNRRPKPRQCFLRRFPKGGASPLKFPPQVLLRRQNQLVFASKQLLILVKHRVAHNGCVFVGAENNAYSRVVVWTAFEIIHDPNVHIHLSNVLVG